MRVGLGELLGPQTVVWEQREEESRKREYGEQSGAIQKDWGSNSKKRVEGGRTK